MIRLLFAALIIGVALFLINTLISLYRASLCPDCEGQGYWEGTRGDKNFCKTCNGRGRETN